MMKLLRCLIVGCCSFFFKSRMWNQFSIDAVENVSTKTLEPMRVLSAMNFVDVRLMTINK